MRTPLVLLFLALFSSPAIHAQTPAQKALNAEPEMQQIIEMKKESDERQNPQDDGVRRPSAIQDFVSLKGGQALLDRLEARLESQAQACNYCASKQDELSELIRQRLYLQNMTEDTLTRFGYDPSVAGGVAKLLGFVPTETRWQNRDIALREAKNAIAGHCNRLNAAGSKIPNCQATTEGGAFKLEGAHENAWANCFEKHNWVKTSSERLAYEACMNANDPLTKLCNEERKAAPNAQYCPRFTVIASDVNQLKDYRDRWIATTAQATVTGRDAQQNSAAPNATQTRPSRGKGSAAAVPSSPPQAPAAQPTNIPAPAPANTPANVPAAKPLSTVTGVAGTYEGKYQCAQGVTGLRLDITLADNGSMTGVFRASISGVPPFDLAGHYDSATKQFVLNPVRWESRPLGGYVMVGMQGTFDPSDGTLKGKITNPRCGAFEVIRKEP